MDLGKISVTPKGAYNSTTIYERLDIVSDSGKSYLSRIDKNNKALTDTTAWQLLVEGGSIEELSDADIKEKYESNPDTNAFTDTEKTKLASLENFDDSAIQTELDTKVDKVAGFGLSKNNFSDADKVKLASLGLGIYAKPLHITDPVPTAYGGYVLADVGTYSFGTTLANKYNVGFLSPSGWEIVSIDMPQATKNIPQFANLSFPVTNTATEKVQCVDNFIIYQLLDGQTATITDVPGISAKWVSLDSRNLRIYEDLPNGTILNEKEQVIGKNITYIVKDGETAVVGTDLLTDESKFKVVGLSEEANSIITEIDYSLLVKENGYIRYSDGKKPNTTDTNWQGNKGLIGVSEGDEISYKFIIVPNVAGVAAYDVNGNYLQSKSITGNGQVSGTYIVDSEVKFVKFSYAVGSATINFDSEIKIDGGNSVKTLNNIVNGFETKININSEEINYLKTEIYSQSTDNILEIAEIFQGFQNGSGNIVGLGTDPSWFNTAFIEVVQNTDIIAEKLGGQGADVMTIGFFDSTFNCLISESVKAEINSTLTKNVNDPAIKYVRFSGTYNNITTGIAKIKMSYIDSSVSISDKIEGINEEVSDINLEIEKINKFLNPHLPKYKYDVNHFIHYGQSLSQGDWESSIISNVQKYNSVMFTGTMRVWEFRQQANKYNALVPAIETVFEYQNGETVVGAAVRGETPSVGTAEKLMQLITDEDGFDYNNYDWKILLSNPGMGGTGIVTLSEKNGVYYQRLLADVIAGKSLANTQGKSYGCHAVSWIQGENDVYNNATGEAYYNNMVNLFTNLNNDIKAITGQIEDVNFFLYQTDCAHFYVNQYRYPHIPLAQTRICKNLTNVHFVTPIFIFPKIGDFIHLTAVGSKWMGGYFGIAYKRILIDGKKESSLTIKEAFVQGNNIYVSFNVPKPPLCFDTTNQIDRGIGKGFQIREINDFANNSYLDIITGVEIIRPDMIKVSCSQSPIGKKLTYAVSNANSYGITSQYIGGNVRDSQDIKFSFKESVNATSETVHDMFNWLPISEVVL